MREIDDKVFHVLSKKVFQLMDDQLSPDLLYHDKSHTVTVIKAAHWLSGMEHNSPSQTRLIKIAALFHDTGFVDSYEEHEKRSSQIADKFLTDHHFPQHEIRQIKQLILATKIPHKPQNNMEMIICDADLYYLGGKEYLSISNQLREELIRYDKISANEEAWNKFQLRFLEKHHFFTSTAKDILEPVKQEYIKGLREKVKNI